MSFNILNMNKLFFIAFMGAMISLSFDSPLTIGDNVPDFEAIDDKGNSWTLYDHLNSDYLVVYFYLSEKERSL